MNTTVPGGSTAAWTKTKTSHQTERAQFIFQQAIEIAHHAGSLNRAGLAALTMIEEIDTLPHEVQAVAYAQAREWLASSDSPDIKPRLRAIRKKIDGIRRRSKAADVREVLFNKRLDLRAEDLKFERGLISQTLARVNGRVTDAAKLLGVAYQTLAYIIETKHPDLLKKRRQYAAAHVKSAQPQTVDPRGTAALRTYEARYIFL